MPSAALYPMPLSQNWSSMTRVAVATTPVTVADVVLVVVWDTAVSTVKKVVVVVSVAVVVLDTVVAGAVTPRSEQREVTFVGAKRRRRGVERSGQVVGRAPRRRMMEARRWVVVVDVDVVVVDMAAVTSVVVVRVVVVEVLVSAAVNYRGGQLP